MIGAPGTHLLQDPGHPLQRVMVDVLDAHVGDLIVAVRIDPVLHKGRVFPGKDVDAVSAQADALFAQIS